MNESETRSSRPGCLVAADDLQIGQYYAAHSWKQNPGVPVPIAGEAFRLVAMQLPFIVGQVASQGVSVTLDTRFVTVMRVTEEFAAAQQLTTPARQGEQ